MRISKINSELYIVATPIGNLQDISQRAISILKTVDWIAAEDTRHSQKLLTPLGIQCPLLSYHAHNEQKVAVHLLQKLKNGLSGAIISDAGTPLISDPGFEIVRLAHQNTIPVVPIPGPCAFIAALSALGFNTQRFAFEGFLPSKSLARQKVLEELQNSAYTLIFYEAPHRIRECLHDMHTIFGGQREIGIARELTKQFEQIKRGSLSSILSQVEQLALKPKGEWVIVLQAEPPKPNVHVLEPLLLELLEWMPLKKAVGIVARESKFPKNQVYELALSLKANK